MTLSKSARLPRLDRWCYVIAACLFASGLAHLVVQAVLGGPWEGPVSWRKPTTFGLAFGLTLATITWVTTYVPVRARLRAGLLAVFSIACVGEVVVITVQAWRQVPSHFNVTTPVNSAFAYSAAAGGAIIIITTVIFAMASARKNPEVPPSMRLAVRAGFVSFLAALGIGAFMIALGVGTARTVSQTAAYTVGVAYKSGHAATMHGILILPVLAWLAARTGWDESRRVRIVALGCIGYLVAAGTVVIDTFLAVDPLAPLDDPLLSTLCTGTGMTLLAIAGCMVLAGVLSRRERTPASVRSESG